MKVIKDIICHNSYQPKNKFGRTFEGYEIHIQNSDEEKIISIKIFVSNGISCCKTSGTYILDKDEDVLDGGFDFYFDKEIIDIFHTTEIDESFTKTNLLSLHIKLIDNEILTFRVYNNHTKSCYGDCYHCYYDNDISVSPAFVRYQGCSLDVNL